MSDYSKTTDFAIKDTLIEGDPQKRILGSEFDVEFNNIQASVRTKVDKVDNATPGHVAILTTEGNITDSGIELGTAASMNITISPADPDPETGQEGDIWFKYEL